ncbi:hypothetical protein INS49_005633 [Diaporthe citri]|uniref:uncharacterized protein n=1 Tax=Diaporthe citri TaxID=83186 RepID=UPI001C8046E6|nr:uncharacterized protein INS49_005633 [Diaporthe citri]KAG6353452.1 hypothetical protein INS49_005633 [Diaporthe citri]
MEVDRTNFWQNLPYIFKTISEARYVAVDLEMSGIYVDQFRDTETPVKPTLQQEYDDARKAAKLFSILQFGFTCISWDPERKSYVTKTFNLPLHPGVVVEDVTSKSLVRVVDRCFRLSTITLDFLESNHFSLAHILQRGVPYLSASELNRKATFDFIDGKRQAGELIDVNELSTKSTEFRNDVEWKIINWRMQRRSGAHVGPVIIRNSQGHRLNSLQKRLVHELLQDQFSDLRAVARYGGAHMEIFDASQQTSGHKSLERTRAVSKQIGARLLWDAICGQPFVANVDIGLIVGQNPIQAMRLKAELKEYESRLRNRSPVLVGHNILMDLCFLHSNFVAPVPKSLQEFRALTRERLPRIVDTKYLFTRGGDEMSPDYSLGECFDAAGNQLFPVVAPDPYFSYRASCPHQAGYDSFMTAVVFLKKSYQLSQARQGLWYIASEDLGEGEALRSRSTSFSSPKLNQRRASLALLKAAPPPPLPPMPDIPKVPSPPLGSRGNTAKPRPANLLEDRDEEVEAALPPPLQPMPQSSKDSSGLPFRTGTARPDNLLEERDEDVVTGLAKYQPMQPEGRHAAPATAPPTPDESPERKPGPDQKPQRKSSGESPARAVVPGTVPEWEGKFWSKYGNRSRVGRFGHILYIGKMAGEQLPGEAGECKTEKLGTQMLEELGRKTSDEDGEGPDNEGPEDEGPEREVECSIHS